MTRLVLTVLLVGLTTAAACKSEPKRGPALTPVVANQLRALAGDCTVRNTNEGRTREIRSCTGRQSTMTIHLDDKRHLLKLEVRVFAPLRDEALLLIKQALRGLVTEKLLGELDGRLNRTGESLVVDGVKLEFHTTHAEGQNPQYAIALVW